ncbi:unnamed protein product [Angiostrongylus costaricensis]|uniref:Protein kinase domain-containing protein n=1 Tax=Angiostrongylus costaricensis TaxID=334426 RepID=A0A0R3PD74_ANGCS|nr:unnamed protein product [Angiostrongylus costaricensis]
MMVARVKEHSRIIRSEPSICPSNNEEGDPSDDNEEHERQPRKNIGKFVSKRQNYDDTPSSKPNYGRNKEDTFARTTSAQTISVCDHLEEGSQMSVYCRTLHLLATDPIYQKEVALGKRIGFYRLGKELGAGNFSKVKLGIHVLTKGFVIEFNKKFSNSDVGPIEQLSELHVVFFFKIAQ